MPARGHMARLLRAQREAERLAAIDQDRRTRLAVQEAIARRALYSTFGRRIDVAPIDPPKERNG